MSKANQGGPAGQGSDSEAVAVLRAVRAKIEQGWCQRAYAKDSGGGRVPPDSPYAVCWCVLGAYRAVTHNDNPGGPFRFISRALDGTGYLFADDWQDEPRRTRADVLAFVDKAIALASAASAGGARPQEDPQP